jgi:GntR family transcriptional regulator/MocR family aminotransferase
MPNYPFFNEIFLDRHSEVALYIQLSNNLARLIKRGILKPGFKLPGTRIMARHLDVNRNTVVAALGELEAEGWIYSRNRSGWYINEDLPVVSPRSVNGDLGMACCYPERTGFALYEPALPELEYQQSPQARLAFDDGSADPRLAPLQEYAREYASVLKSPRLGRLLEQVSPLGDRRLREIYTPLLNQYRGLNVQPDQMILTRGATQAIFLLSHTLLQPGDTVVVGESSYEIANQAFRKAGARLLRIPIDDKGLDTDALSQQLKQEAIRLVYVPSHHYWPTTVSLSPERRVQLLELARQYHFAILEDDYDYDYHYQHKPLLPIASADCEGYVIYIGSYSKKLFPAARAGFILAPNDLIQRLMQVRQLIGDPGDPIQERAIARLIELGTMRRYGKKALHAYRKRRDHLCKLLQEELNFAVDFQVPEGGMAVWARFKPQFPLPEIAARCREKGLLISDGRVYNPPGANWNACRLGFAALNTEELSQAFQILKSSTLEVQASKAKMSVHNL